MAKVALRYEFIFDPAETWAHLTQFEETLAKFFSAASLEAEVVRTQADKDGMKILYITKKAPIVAPSTAPKKKNTDPAKENIFKKALRAIDPPKMKPVEKRKQFDPITGREKK